MTVHHFTFHITDKSDASDIREVETRAFGFSKEADLVASLLEDESARPALSHPGGAQSLLDDAITHRSAHDPDRPHPVRRP